MVNDTNFFYRVNLKLDTLRCIKKYSWIHLVKEYNCKLFTIKYNKNSIENNSANENIEKDLITPSVASLAKLLFKQEERVFDDLGQLLLQREGLPISKITALKKYNWNLYVDPGWIEEKNTWRLTLGLWENGSNYYYYHNMLQQR